jgi:N-acetylmuramoyl-L-alanine amidase
MSASVRLIVALVLALTADAAEVRAQTVDALFADAIAKETAVRKVLGSPSPPETVLKAVRTVVADYEDVVRRYPSSSFCDDALWRAATLSSDAFKVFHDPREQTMSVRLLQALGSQYPASRFAKQAPAQIAALKAIPPAAPVRIESPTPPRGASASPLRPTTPRIATIKAIRRVILNDVIRIVIEFDKEVQFRDERLESPPRVFVDLPSTRAAAEFKDQTIRFESDADLVRQVRIGRHPNNTTRVVLDAAGVSSYSVYPLYSPYRLIIDCLRAVPVAGSSATLPFPTPPKPPPPSILTARSLAAAVARLPAAVPDASTAIALAVEEDRQATLPATPVMAAGATAILPRTTPSRNLAGGYSIARQLGLGVSRIVIDPGHGGHDPGTKNEGASEAEIVLDISLRVERLLHEAPDVEVVLTRRGDEYVSLQERTAIANRENADLFLSIHANASDSPRVQGIETYFLNFATNLGAAAVAARENAASGQSMGELPDVVKTIALNNKIDESRDFATFVQREMMAKLRPANRGLRDLGVKQAPFVVLIGAAMPSVLAEVSFMTNAQDAKLLKTAAYRQRIAEALFEAIRTYQTSLKKGPTIAQQSQR